MRYTYRVRRIVGLAIAALLALPVTAGCTRGTGSGNGELRGDLYPAGTLVRYDAGTARVRVQQLVVVDFGTVNTSIGDSWHLVTKPDPAVLTERGPMFESACQANQAGCDAQLRWEFKAAAAGTTSMVFRYCYRSQPTNCQPAPTDRGPAEPVTLDVTVG
jgi:hypothetical protein